MASQPIDQQIAARVQPGEPIIIAEPLPDGDLLGPFTRILSDETVAMHILSSRQNVFPLQTNETPRN
jgi:hypothetical protein